MLWSTRHSSEWWTWKKEPWVWSTANTLCTIKGPVYELCALNEVPPHPKRPKGNFTGHTIFDFRHNGELWTQRQSLQKNRVGWSLTLKWFGKRTDMDWSIQMGWNYSLHRHPKGVNGTCSHILPWTRYKVFVIVPRLYIFREVLAKWECLSTTAFFEICHEELADLFHFHAMWFCLSRGSTVCHIDRENKIELVFHQTKLNDFDLQSKDIDSWYKVLLIYKPNETQEQNQ